MNNIYIKGLSNKIDNLKTLETLYKALNNYALLCEASEIHEVNVLQNKVFDKLQSYKRK